MYIQDMSVVAIGTPYWEMNETILDMNSNSIGSVSS
jgi:hypothetical protein